MACSKRRVRCPARCGHFQIVEDYRRERVRQSDERDNAVGAYGEDSEEFAAHPAPITFREYLESRAGMAAAEEEDPAWV